MTINTDNRTVSGVTLGQEFLLAKETLRLSEEEIFQCTYNAIETAFAEDDIKQKLYQMLEA